MQLSQKRYKIWDKEDIQITSHIHIFQICIYYIIYAKMKNKQNFGKRDKKGRKNRISLNQNPHKHSDTNIYRNRAKSKPTHS